MSWDARCICICLCHAIYRQVLEPLVVLLLPECCGARYPLKMAEADSYPAKFEYWTPIRTLFYRYYCRKLRGLDAMKRYDGTYKEASRNTLREKAMNAAAVECRRRVEGALETIRLVDTLFITFLFSTFVNPPQGLVKDANVGTTTAHNIYAVLVGLAMIFGMFVMLVLARFRNNMDYCPCAPQLLAFIATWEHVLGISFQLMMVVVLLSGAAALVAGYHIVPYSCNCMIGLTAVFAVCIAYVTYLHFSMWAGCFGTRILTMSACTQTDLLRSCGHNVNRPSEAVDCRMCGDLGEDAK